MKNKVSCQICIFYSVFEELLLLTDIGHGTMHTPHAHSRTCECIDPNPDHQISFSLTIVPTSDIFSMSALNPSRFRLLKLEKLQKQIFNQTFNPMRLKTGAKILRQPLKGHYYKNWYYPDAVPRPRELKMLLPELNPVDPIEQKRLRRVAE